MVEQSRNDDAEKMLEHCKRVCAEATESAEQTSQQAMERICSVIYDTYHVAHETGQVAKLAGLLPVRKGSIDAPAVLLRGLALEALGRKRRQLAYNYGDALGLAWEDGVTPDQIAPFVRSKTLTGAAKEYGIRHRSLRRRSYKIADLAALRKELQEKARQIDPKRVSPARLCYLQAWFDPANGNISITVIKPPSTKHQSDDSKRPLRSRKPSPSKKASKGKKRQTKFKNGKARGRKKPTLRRG